MSAEIRPERKRLPKSTRAKIREEEAAIRKEMGITKPSLDSSNWEKAVGILKVKLNGWDEQFAQFTPALKMFFEIRQKIRLTGYKPEMFKEFQSKYGPKVIERLKPALTLITEIVGKQR